MAVLFWCLEQWKAQSSHEIKQLLNLLGVLDSFLKPDANLLYDSEQITLLFLASIPLSGIEDAFKLWYFLSRCPILLFLCNLIFS